MKRHDKHHDNPKSRSGHHGMSQELMKKVGRNLARAMNQQGHRTHSGRGK